MPEQQSIEEDLISFECAKLAKDKGFNGNCLSSYNEDQQLEYAKDFIGELYITEECIRNAWDNEYICYLAPTQALLQKWLREVHNIHVEVLVIKSVDLNVKYVGLVSFIEDNIWKRVSLNKEFNTFEEITEEGLKEALKLIK